MFLGSQKLLIPVSPLGVEMRNIDGLPQSGASRCAIAECACQQEGERSGSMGFRHVNDASEIELLFHSLSNECYKDIQIVSPVPQVGGQNPRWIF
jgi:hypothetical protein